MQQRIYSIFIGAGTYFCSLHGDDVCVSGAVCIDLQDLEESANFQCVCPEGSFGDGLRTNGTGCRYADCPAGMIQDGFNCYQFYDQPTSFDAALRACKQNGGSLTSFSTHEDVGFVADHVTLVGEDRPLYWIGLTDERWKGIFRWVDGTAPVYDNWAPGEPQHLQQNMSHTCVVLDTRDFQFYTRRCDDHNRFICKRTQLSQVCAVGWTRLGLRCVVVLPTPVDYYTAHLTCLTLDSSLVSLRDDTNQSIASAVADLLPDDDPHWIGLSSNFFDPASGLLWSDGSPGETDTLKNVESPSPVCYTLESNVKLSTDSCVSSKPFVCSKDNKETIMCPVGSVKFNQHCYKLKPKPWSTWSDALKQCRSVGGSLMSIASQAEQRFIGEFLAGRSGNNVTNYWIGLTVKNSNSTNSLSFDWSDETQYVFSNWPDASGPTGYSGNYQCTVLDSSNQYTWKTANCAKEHPSICKYINRPCSMSSECHSNGVCYLGQCRCNDGYRGDGLFTCFDIDECKRKPCDINAECTNMLGSFTCTCAEGYVGNGLICTNAQACSRPADCHRSALCGPDGLCRCKQGYSGNGKTMCSNVDECALNIATCDVNAQCTDTEGSYACTCRAGFSGNGTFCQPIPRSCEEYQSRGGNIISGKFEIDPDGIGGVEPFMVSCEFRGDVSVTVVGHNTQSKISVTQHESYSMSRTVLYGEGSISISQLRALIDNSSFCYQELYFDCVNGAKLFNNTYWVDGSGKVHFHWPGGSSQGQCACGVLGVCVTPQNGCNCDGTVTSSIRIDSGIIIDRQLLPVTRITSGGMTSPGARANFYVGPLKCGAQQFDIPRHCNEATRYVSGPVLIDLDGPSTGLEEPTLEPFLVYCDMSSYPHVGVTQIPHDSRRVLPSNAGTFNVTYVASLEAVAKMLATLEFCSQYLEYQCQNSRIHDDITGKTYATWRSQDGATHQYWPGGDRHHGGCACGVTKSCSTPGQRCNCAARVSSEERKDFGLLTEKTELPVMSVTVLDVGEDRTAGVVIGWLSCAPVQFGIAASCQAYRQLGHQDNYTYLIDPDGPPTDNEQKNEEPFLAICEMGNDIAIGITVFSHDRETKQVATSVGGDIPVVYRGATTQQIEALVSRSSYCTMQFTYECFQSSLHGRQPGRMSYWVSRGLKSKKHWAGSGIGSQLANSCGCGLTGTCDVPTVQCNCDLRDSKRRIDNGFLTRKEDFPMTSVRFRDVSDAASQANYTLGRLMCYEVFETCASLAVNFRQVSGSPLLTPMGRYVIDPDGPFGVDPFQVICDFPLKTLLYVTNGQNPAVDSSLVSDPSLYAQPYATCANFAYGNTNTDQLKALTLVSGFCMQYANYSCLNSPLSTHSYWVNRDGRRMPGWAGNANGQKCACGETATCDGGPATSCNCDSLDGAAHYDHGVFIHKEHLPVSLVCFGYTAETTGRRYVGIVIGELVCAPRQIDIVATCQDRRNDRIVVSETWIIDPDTADGPAPPFPAYCAMTVDPPVGVTVISSNLPSCEILSNAAVNRSVKYNGVVSTSLRALTSISTYCTQEMFLGCSKGRPLALDAPFGWYTADDIRVPYWAGNTGGIGCVGGSCNCSSADKGFGQIGGLLLDKSVLPVGSVRLAASSSPRCLTVGPLKCYSVYRNCDEILRNKQTKNPNQNAIYAIDPDQAGGRELFGAVCSFPLHEDIGITYVQISDGSHAEVSPDTANATVLQILYQGADVMQIRGLVTTSGFCSQSLLYGCKSVPLINSFQPFQAAFRSHDGSLSSTWAGADGADDDILGCACTLLGTCPTDRTCRCDAISDIIQEESGLVTSLKKLPMKEIVYSGSPPDGFGYINVGSIGCAPIPFGLPYNCDEAFRLKQKTGEVLIWPRRDLQPFLVFCDMDLLPRAGVTVIYPSSQGRHEVTPVMQVSYRQASIEQVVSVVQRSSHCYMPVRLDCFATQFLGADSVDNAWVGADGSVHHYFGKGLEGQCTCGWERSCGGRDGQTAMQKRACNCDANDAESRSDAGLLSITSDLPVVEFHFNSILAAVGLQNSSASLSLGALYCSTAPFDIDECRLGFHDCHPLAECINTAEGFQCVCKVGYKGIGVDNVWANGRQCIDDNECTRNVCPPNTICQNMPGSYQCICQQGYQKMADGTCHDVDECASGQERCDQHARCYNTQGSYRCSCQEGFRGDGFTCSGVTSCRCWGDPHCLSFDKRINHFQGSCRYLLARDNCIEGFPLKSAAPTFMIIQKNWRGAVRTELPVSWVKEIHVYVHGIIVELRQHCQVALDGRVIRWLPVRPIPEHTQFVVYQSGTYIVVETGVGVVVRWNGQTIVEVEVDESLRNRMCGLCGNFNGIPDDDWIVGPECSGSGRVTEIATLFGHSWRYGIDSDPDCSWNCTGSNDPVCSDPVSLAQAQQYCGVLTDPRGKFKDCLASMPADMVTELADACIYDLCLTRTNMTSSLCDNAKALVDRCLKEFHVHIVNWRDQHLCPITCSGGMTYMSCGPQVPRSCNSKDNVEVAPAAAATSCVEGCFCREGYVQEADSCIKPEACGCEQNGFYYPVGYSFMTAICKEKCTCPSVRGELNCTDWTCGVGQSCMMRDGVLDCYCDPGFTETSDACQDIDECQTPPPHVTDGSASTPCSPDATCTNTVGSFICTCDDGYRGNGFHCSDVDECTEGTHTCDVVSTVCANTPGSYECRCKDGFRIKPETGDNDSIICEDVDECIERTDDCDGAVSTCQNLFGGYHCVLLMGFARSRDTQLIVDVDECTLEASLHCSTNAVCTNLVGSYTCMCKQGFTGDGQQCNDVDECLMETHDCGNHADCVNVVGNYQCHCHHGYASYCNECLDVDECATGTASCNRVHSVCINTPGSYICKCIEGFAGDGQICIDVDECDLGTAFCPANSYCVNNIGSFECQCLPGFHSSRSNECLDNDECSTSEHFCHSSAVCFNVVGSYECHCKPGFTGDGFSCESEDPKACGSDLICDVNAICQLDSSGLHHTCVCAAGFQGLGHMTPSGEPGCQPVNLCVHSVCSRHADCTQLAGRAICTCHKGFVGNGYTCRPESLCDLPLACGVGATCRLNVDAIKECICSEGYVSVDNFHCTDRDECQSDHPPCPANSLCYNTPGSFRCTCHVGFVFSDVTRDCQDVDECTEEAHDCDDTTRALCVNNVGSYTCSCKPGFTGDGHICVEVYQCDLDCVDERQFCHLDHALRPECICKTGFSPRLKDDIVVCEDVAECRRQPCHTNAVCIELSPGYRCQCKPGYEGNGVLCVDTDECVKHSDNCPVNSLCLNVDGSFVCQCKPGYRSTANRQCRLIPSSEDVCRCGHNGVCDSELGVCQCHEGFVFEPQRLNQRCRAENHCARPDACHPFAECIENEDSYRCICLPGTVGDGFDYCEVDRCANGAVTCSVHASCVSSVGQFRCQCHDGYHGDGYLCVKAIAGCANGQLAVPCGPNAHCVNLKRVSAADDVDDTTRTSDDVTVDSTCECDLGYSGDGETCIDIDECEFASHASGLPGLDTGRTNPVCDPERAMCVNVPGSYRCECLSGFSGNGTACEDIDECTDNSHNCPPNTVCRNEIGGYTCQYEVLEQSADYVVNECTRGRPCDPHADCIQSPSNGIFKCRCHVGYIGNGKTCRPICTADTCPASQVCTVVGNRPRCMCHCSDPDCDLPGLVCASNGRTYSSYRQMVLRACQQNMDVKLSYWGKCNCSCQSIQCPGLQVCVLRHGIAVCECPPCEVENDTDVTNSSPTGPLCTMSGVTYSDRCAYLAVQCRQQIIDPISHYGECFKPTDCQYSLWSAWSACSATCGQGIQSRTRNVTEAIPPEGCLELIEQTRPCYIGLCIEKKGKCLAHRCNRPGEYCTVDVHTGQPTCRCPICNAMSTAGETGGSDGKNGEQPVCATIGEKLVTVDNMCQLRERACQSNQTYQLLHFGPCQEGQSNKPAGCSMMPLTSVVMDQFTGCVTKHPVDVNSCDGGCGSIRGRCCVPEDFVYIPVDMICSNGTEFTAKVIEINRCSCVDSSEKTEIRWILAEID